MGTEAERTESDSADRQQALGEALAAHLIIEAANQYAQQLINAGRRNIGHPHADVLLATVRSLGVASRLAHRAFERAARRAGVDGLAADDDAAEAAQRFILEVGNLAHLHLEAPSN